MLKTLKLKANLIESSCLIFVNCFLPFMIIVSFHACGLRWSICFLQSRRGSQGWHFLFLWCGVSHGQKGGATQKKVTQKNSLTFSLFNYRRLQKNVCEQWMNLICLYLHTVSQTLSNIINYLLNVEYEWRRYVILLLQEVKMKSPCSRLID